MMTPQQSHLAGNKPDEKCTEAKPLMHMQRQDRHRQTDNDEGGEYCRHYRHQRCDGAALSRGLVEWSMFVVFDAGHSRKRPL